MHASTLSFFRLQNDVRGAVKTPPLMLAFSLSVSVSVSVSLSLCLSVSPSLSPPKDVSSFLTTNMAPSLRGKQQRVHMQRLNNMDVHDDELGDEVTIQWTPNQWKQTRYAKEFFSKIHRKAPIPRRAWLAARDVAVRVLRARAAKNFLGANHLNPAIPDEATEDEKADAEGDYTEAFERLTDRYFRSINHHEQIENKVFKGTMAIVFISLFVAIGFMVVSATMFWRIIDQDEPSKDALAAVATIFGISSVVTSMSGAATSYFWKERKPLLHELKDIIIRDREGDSDSDDEPHDDNSNSSNSKRKRNERNGNKRSGSNNSNQRNDSDENGTATLLEARVPKQEERQQEMKAVKAQLHKQQEAVSQLKTAVMSLAPSTARAAFNVLTLPPGLSGHGVIDAHDNDDDDDDDHVDSNAIN